MSYNQDATFYTNQIVLENTNTEYSNLLVDGGVSLQKTYISGNQKINDVDITPNPNDVISEIHEKLNSAENPTDIPNFFFVNSLCSSFTAYVNLTTITPHKQSFYKINGFLKNNYWYFTSSFTGDQSDFIFNINNTTNQTYGDIGQMQYTCPSSESRIRFRITTNSKDTVSSSEPAVIYNTKDNIEKNKLLYAKTPNILGSSDISFNNEKNTVEFGNLNTLVINSTSEFVDYTKGGALTCMGDVSINGNLFVDGKILIGNTDSDSNFDINGDILLDGGELYQNNELRIDPNFGVYLNKIEMNELDISLKYTDNSSINSQIKKENSSQNYVIDSSTDIKYSGEWIQLEFPDSVEINKFSITSTSDFAPQQLILSGSNTVSNSNISILNADVLYTTSNLSWSIDETKNFDLQTTSNYPVYRLLFPEITNTIGGLQISDISFTDSQLRNYPASSLTSSSTLVSNQQYGNGEYKVFSSSETNGNSSYFVFDGNSETYWESIYNYTDKIHNSIMYPDVKFQTDNKKILFKTANIDRMVLTTSGNLGINTSEPLYQLHVNGTVAKPEGGNWQTISDERVKDDIQLADLQWCYNVVKSIPLKRWKWKSEYFTNQEIDNDFHRLGIIAQDLEEYLPESIKINNQFDILPEDTIQDTSPAKFVDSSKLMWCMYGAVQKLTSEIEQIEQQLDI